MNKQIRSLCVSLAVTALVLSTSPFSSAANSAAASRDGSHDFDFNIGVWKTHIKRLTHPLSGSSDSIELNGIVTVKKIWDGRALLEEIEADGPNGHWEGMSLFLYNPQAHQWSQTFANSKDGTLDVGMIGEFTDHRGELFSRDTFDGRSILVRGTWTDITPNSHRYEEAFSTDGGRTWETVFSASKVKEKS